MQTAVRCLFMYPIHHVGFNVSDLQAAEDFYRLFDFRRVRTFQAGGREFAMLGNGSAQVELFPAMGEIAGRPPQPPGFRHLCLRSDDVERDYLRLRDRVEFDRPPFRHDGLLIAFLKGADGVAIELYQEM